MQTMLSAIRKRLSYANFAVTAALVFAMAGGAFAASGGAHKGHGAKHKGGKYVITTAKQIKPSVLKQLKGAAGPAGPAGEKGATGAAGATGPAGAAGKNGTNGANGAPGTNGENGKSVVASAAAAGECQYGGTKLEVEGSGKPEHVCNGQSGFTATLPETQTETGVWGTGGETTTSPVLTPIAYNIPLAAAPAHEYVSTRKVVAKEWHANAGELCEAETGSELEGCEKAYEQNRTACPGTAEEPQAVPGTLCVYEKLAVNVKQAPSPGVLTVPNVNGKYGALIGVYPLNHGELVSVENTAHEVKTVNHTVYLQAYGTWAVTEEVGA